MKNLLSIAVGATVLTGFAANYNDPQLIEGQVGVTKIDSRLANTIVAMSYNDLAEGGQMSLANVVKTTNLTVGDQLAVFNDKVDGSASYSTWMLAEKEDGVKYWNKNTATFSLNADGVIDLGSADEASAISRPVGTGFWLCRQDPSKPFYIYGRPSASKTVTTEAGKWTLVGNPNQTPVALNSISMTNLRVLLDQISYVTGTGKLRVATYRGASVGWVSNKEDGSGTEQVNPTIPAGQGFWIKTTNSVTINW